MKRIRVLASILEKKDYRRIKKNLKTLILMSKAPAAVIKREPSFILMCQKLTLRRSLNTHRTR